MERQDIEGPTNASTGEADRLAATSDTSASMDQIPRRSAPLAVEYRPAAALIPFAKNARTHSDAQVAQIAASIREFGWTNPILVDGDNGIIAGHGRLLAARKLGMATVPVIELAGLSEAQKRALIIADNKLALNAGWDNELLGLELGDLGEPRLRPVADRLRRAGDRGADQPRHSRPDRSRRHSRGSGAADQPPRRCLAARQASADLRRQHQCRRCRAGARRREAASAACRIHHMASATIPSWRERFGDGEVWPRARC